MSSISRLFHFDAADNLIVKGIPYTKINYDSLLEEELVLKLQDPSLAKTIYSAYTTYIKPKLTENEQENFSKALLKIAILWGSKTYSSQALIRALREEGFSDDWIEKHDIEFSSFVKEATLEESFSSRTDKPFRVCILTTSASGGNASVAQAVHEWLVKQPDMEARIIDVEKVAQKYDPIKIVSEKYTYDGLYEEFFQKRALGENVLYERDRINKKISQYIQPRTGEKLKDKIRKFAPDLIITTRNYKQDDLNIGYNLNIPTRVLYCDYDVCVFHLDLIGKTHPALLKFWFPALGPEGFESFFKNHHAEHLYDSTDSWDVTLKKISDITHAPFEELKSSFEEVGFPVRKEFDRLTDQVQLQALREKWKVCSDERAVIVSMGKNGVGTIENIFSDLAGLAKHSIPIKYFFICGTNEDLKKRLDQNLLSSDLSESALSSCTICGFLSSQEMSELMNISSLMCSKPGGSTVGECIEIGLPIFIMHSHHLWEGGNARQLRKLGLSYVYSPDLPFSSLTKQIEASILQHDNKKPSVIDWKSQLESIFKSFTTD